MTKKYFEVFVCMYNVFIALSPSVPTVVNVSRSQLLFNSLVSLSIQEDQLISQVLQDRWLLAMPPPRSHDTKAAEGPSLLFFMTSNLFRQKTLPQEEELGTWKLSPMLCPAYTTFDLHRRQRCWETTL